MDPKLVRQDAVEARKAELKAMGMAGFYTVIDSDKLSMDDSIRRDIAEKMSFFFVCVQDPYFGMRGNKGTGNMRFRLFQTLKDKPSIPMGYSYMPSFAFECYDGQPAQQAIKLLKEKLKMQYTFKVKDDEITLIRVKDNLEKVQDEMEKQNEANKLLVQPGDSAEVVAIKTKIKDLMAGRDLYLAVNKAIRANDDAKLKALLPKLSDE